MDVRQSRAEVSVVGARRAARSGPLAVARLASTRALLAGGLLAGATSPAEGQGVRSGFWLEGSVGTGTVRSSCSGCEAVTAAYGGTDYLRMGGSVSPRVLVGLEIFALSAGDLTLGPATATVDAENWSVAPIVIWYVGRSGFFLRGGAGLAHGTFTVRTTDGETVTTERTGSTLTFGLGFDIGVVRWLALTANLGTNVMAIGDVDVMTDGTSVDDIIATVYEASIGITLR